MFAVAHTHYIPVSSSGLPLILTFQIFLMEEKKPILSCVPIAMSHTLKNNRAY